MSAGPDIVAEARAVHCASVLERRGYRLKRHGHELAGPCPRCGGTDRFSIHLRKNVFHCRKGGAGGDAIALVQYLDDCDFLSAVEWLVGRQPEREERTRGEEARRADREAREASDNKYRRGQIERGRKIWEGADRRDIIEAYFAWRGLELPHGAKLRGHASVAYYERLEASQRFEQVYEGPAMIGAIQGEDGRFEGAHVTWIDPRLAMGKTALDPKGKARIVHPETGARCPAKKVIGSARAGHIHLGGPSPSPGRRADGAGPPSPAGGRGVGGEGAAVLRRLIVGEGIETTLAVWSAFANMPDLLAETAFWAAINLQNIGGKAQFQIFHPSATTPDSAGRERRMRVPGPEPLISLEHPALMPPDEVVEALTLGDGDSDRFAAKQVHARAALRWAMPLPPALCGPRLTERLVHTAWAAEGADFNDMIQVSG